MAVVTDGWRCNISDDCMSATLFMTEPKSDEHITVEDVTLYMRANGVLSGLVYSEIEKAIKERIYYKDVVVAKGRPLVETQPGHYEFLFSVHFHLDVGFVRLAGDPGCAHGKRL